MVIICKIAISNVQLVKSNLKARKHYRLKLSTRKTLKMKFLIFNSLNTTCNSKNNFFKFATHKKQLAARKKQLATHNFISIWQNKFATHKITLQLI